MSWIFNFLNHQSCLKLASLLGNVVKNLFSISCLVSSGKVLKLSIFISWERVEVKIFEYCCLGSWFGFICASSKIICLYFFFRIVSIGGFCVCCPNSQEPYINFYSWWYLHSMCVSFSDCMWSKKCIFPFDSVRIKIIIM